MTRSKPSLDACLIAEFIGTFALVFVGCGSMMVDAITGGQLGHVGVSAAFGLVIMVMIFSTGHISGAHFNPAVTLAFVTLRKIRLWHAAGYCITQIAAAIAASACLYAILGSVGTMGGTHPASHMSFEGVFLLEVILTFFLMFVIVCVATDSRSVGSLAGVAIGGTVTLASLMGGPLTGSSMNPARTLGPAIVGGHDHHVALYLVAPCLGALLGAWTYQVIRGHGGS